MTQMKLPNLTITHVRISDLHLDPKNPRLHSKRQIKQIGQSIKSFGFNTPILIDASNKVIAGHGRMLACQQLGFEEVPTICLEHLTDSQARAFAIADNRLTENSEWDDELLALHFKELSNLNLDFNLEATGFTLDEIDFRLEAASGIAVPDPADQIPPESCDPPVSKVGDLFLLGPHRLLCGDATKREDIDQLMNGSRAAMVFTDPPYNVNYANAAKDKLQGTNRPILNDHMEGDAFRHFLLGICQNVLAVTDGVVYVCMSSSELHNLQAAFIAAGGHWSTFIIWAKQMFTLGRSDYQRQYEPILYGWREGVKRHWCGDRNQSDLWFFDKPAKSDLHPTQKPVELVIRALRNSCERGELVLDPFLGSGTTLIAAERAGRVCYGMELDPKYIDTIIRRWQNYTGERATHTTTGKPFDQLVTEGGERD